MLATTKEVTLEAKMVTIAYRIGGDRLQKILSEARKDPDIKKEKLVEWLYLATERPQDYGEDPHIMSYAEGWFPIGVGRHRDSDLLAESNFQVVLADMEKRYPKYAGAHTSSHWAVGWVEGIRVWSKSPKAALAGYRWYHKLHDEYPVADDDHYSDMQYEYAEKEYDNWVDWEIKCWAEENDVRFLLNEDGDYDPPENVLNEVKWVVTDYALEHGPEDYSLDSRYGGESLWDRLLALPAEMERRALLGAGQQEMDLGEV